MTTISVDEIQYDLVGCLNRVQAGETLLVTQAGRPVAEINPVESVEPDDLPLTRRPSGLAEGEFIVPDDFDDPLPDEIQRFFEGCEEPCAEAHGYWAKTPRTTPSAHSDQTSCS